FVIFSTFGFRPSSLLEVCKINVDRRLPVDLANNFAVARAKGGVELVGLRIRIELFDANLVFAGRHLGDLERPVFFTAPDTRGVLLVGANVRLKRHLHIAGRTTGQWLAIAKHATVDGDQATAIATTAEDQNRHQADQNGLPATKAKHG